MTIFSFINKPGATEIHICPFMVKGLIGLVFISSIIIACSSITDKSIYSIPSDETINSSALPGSEIVVCLSGNRETKGLFYRGEKDLIVIFHGNAGTVNTEIQIARYFIERKFSVLIPEYPGYGISKKYQPTEKNIYADSESLIRHIQNKYNFVPSNTTLYGRSLGAAIAIEMATRKMGGKLILVTPFSSMNDMFILYGAPFIIVPVINSQHYDNLKKAKFLDCPTLIVAGDMDRRTPYTMSLQLFRTFSNAALIVIDSNRHGSVYEDFTAETWKKILNF